MRRPSKCPGDKNLGPIIGSLISQSLLTQAQVANNVGMSRSQICNFLKGRTDIHASTFVDILNVLGIDLVRLVKGEILGDPLQVNHVPHQLKLLPGLEQNTVLQFLKVYQKRASMESMLHQTKENLIA